jgi:uncharacterized protein with NRDE domain
MRLDATKESQRVVTMCVVSWTIKEHLDNIFCLSFNRDEFFDRKTNSIHLWEDGFLAGKDALFGGTWLGYHPNGRFAFLTHHRNPILYQNGMNSRGNLVLDYLKSKISPMNYCEQISNIKDSFNGFNLVVGDLNKKRQFYVSNRHNSIIQLDNNNCHSLSNGTIDSIWPKTIKSKKIIEKYQKSKNFHKLIRDQFTDKNTSTIEELQYTGVSQEIEILLSPLFIITPQYGTRSNTVISVDKSMKFEILETTFNSQGEITMESNICGK